MQKKRFLCLMTTLTLLFSFSTAASAEDTLSVIMTARTTQAFTDEAISDADLTTILEAGLSATSAMNQQPWYFSVITNQNVMDEIMTGMSFGGSAEPPANNDNAEPAAADDAEVVIPTADSSAKAALGDSPVAIVIYMDENGAKMNGSFDCGLACQNMVIAASTNAFGGTMISPTLTF